MSTASNADGLGVLNIDTTIDLEASASEAWKVFGEGFGTWDTWSDGIVSSSLNGPVAQGVTRTNDAKGFGMMSQELTEYDPDARALTYEIRTGMPAVIRTVRNAWTIEELGENRSRIVGRARFELTWWAIPLTPLLRKKMAGSLGTFAGELASHLAQKP